MSEQAASWDMMDCTKQHGNNMANAKQVLDVHVSKGITMAQSNEHMRNWTEKGWKRATDLGNYDPTREHLNFEVVSGGKIRPIDKGRSIPERMTELLHKQGIKDPNEGLEEPRFRTVVNIIFGGSRTRMQELAFGKQEVDFEKGADNRHIKRKSDIERWAKDVYSFVCGRYGEQNIAATDQYCICTEKDGVYTMALYTKDGEQEKVLTSGEWYAQNILSTGDRLAVLERDMNSHEKLEIIDLSGNVICSAAPVKDYNAIRIERAGKLIYMPPNLGYSPLPDEAPNDCVIVYDTESRELSEFRPETAQEAGTLRFTPDGKTAVCITETDITNEDKTDLIGVIDKLYMYDTESGTKIKEIEIDTKSPLYMHRVYEDKVMFYELLIDEATDETRQNVQCFYMIDL